MSAAIARSQEEACQADEASRALRERFDERAGERMERVAAARAAAGAAGKKAKRAGTLRLKEEARQLHHEASRLESELARSDQADATEQARADEAFAEAAGCGPVNSTGSPTS